jgi:hypothetical protein
VRPVINIYMKLTHIIEQPAPPEPPPINMQSLVIKVDEVVGQVFQNPQAADELKEAFNALGGGRQMTREQSQALLQYLTILSTN